MTLALVDLDELERPKRRKWRTGSVIAPGKLATTWTVRWRENGVRKTLSGFLSESDAAIWLSRKMDAIHRPPPMPKPRTKGRRQVQYQKAKVGHLACERCGYRPPTFWAEKILHVHHIVPVSFGGGDEPSNLVVICPNCHALAHTLTRRSKKWGYEGPRTREELFAYIAKFEREYRQP